MPITFALTWLLAALSYALVFKPCQALKPLLVPQKTRREGSSSAPSRAGEGDRGTRWRGLPGAAADG
jgi:hypothetical protein